MSTAKPRFEARGWAKFYEEDDRERGCVGPTFYNTGDEAFASDTAEKLVGDICDFLGVSLEHATVNACGEPGRVDVQITENDDASPADGDEIERWHKGEQRLWAATYTFHVERVMRERVVLDAGAYVEDAREEA